MKKNSRRLCWREYKQLSLARRLCQLWNKLEWVCSWKAWVLHHWSDIADLSAVLHASNAVLESQMNPRGAARGEKIPLHWGVLLGNSHSNAGGGECACRAQGDEAGTGCPKKLWMPHPWICTRPRWMATLSTAGTWNWRIKICSNASHSVIIPAGLPC